MLDVGRGLLLALVACSRGLASDEPGASRRAPSPTATASRAPRPTAVDDADRSTRTTARLQAGRQLRRAGGRRADRRRRPRSRRGRTGARRRHQLAAVPEGHGHPEHKETLGPADADRRGGVRRHRADQRPRLPRQPVPGRPGRLGARAAAAGGGVRRRQLSRRGAVASTAAGPYDGGTDRARWRTPATSRRSSTSLDASGRARVADGVDRRRAGAALRVERPTPRPTRRSSGRGPRLPRRRLPDRRLLHAVPLGARSSATSRSACPSGGRPGRPRRRRRSSRCGEDWAIQGGEAVLGQWVEDNRDQNVTCPGVAARPRGVGSRRRAETATTGRAPARVPGLVLGHRCGGEDHVEHRLP